MDCGSNAKDEEGQDDEVSARFSSELAYFFRKIIDFSLLPSERLFNRALRNDRVGSFLVFVAG